VPEDGVEAYRFVVLSINHQLFERLVERRSTVEIDCRTMYDPWDERRPEHPR